MSRDREITAVDVWQVRIPLARPYHLSKLYGTLTHSDAALVRLTLGGGSCGWGEANPGGINFDGETINTVMNSLRIYAPEMLNQNVQDWVELAKGREKYGAAAAALDVACYDALGHLEHKPVCHLLGQQRHDRIASLWPTSSGSADEDLAIISQYQTRGFNTYMLKMGDKPVSQDISRTREVIDRLPKGVAVMVDANQGWSRQEALTFAEKTSDLPVILIEQPLIAKDLDGLHMVRKIATCPISVDESIQHPDEIKAILDKGAADVFSVKISKNGGLANSQFITDTVHDAGKKVLMNSMIELGITQAASMHLGCTLDNLMECGHAYMSTLRMADDVSNFSDWITGGIAHMPDTPGLGINISMPKIRQYEVDSFHVS